MIFKRSISIFSCNLLFVFYASKAFAFTHVNVRVRNQVIINKRTLFKHAFAHAQARNDEDHLIDENIPAYPQQTPHSGRHFLPSHPASQPTSRIKRITRRILNPLRRHPKRIKTKRFMEGWYYRLTLPEDNISFAFIFSIEDPDPSKDSDLALAAVQVMGPNDEYVIQSDPDHRKFWAYEGSQAFGCVFEHNDDSLNSNNQDSCSEALSPNNFDAHVRSGFQMLPTRLQGKVDGHDGSLGGVSKGQGLPRTCDFDLKIRPLSGWGDDQSHDTDGGKSNQKSTGGWLASYSVFEPHWQVTLADARATGYATWNGTRYDFVDAPFYAEKNWVSLMITFVHFI